MEGLIEYQTEKKKASAGIDMISEKESKQKNLKARKLAKERAQYRKMQILLEKQKRMERLATKKLEEQQQLQKAQKGGSGPFAQKSASSTGDMAKDLIREQSMKYILYFIK